VVWLGWWDVAGEGIDWFVGGPGYRSQEHLLDLVVGEVLVFVALHPDEGSGWLAARQGVFVGPDLGDYFAFVGAGAGGGWDDCCGEDVEGGGWGPGHVVEGFVEEGEVGHALHDGVGGVGDGVGYGRAEGVVDFAMLFRAAHEGGEIGWVGSAEGVVEANEAAAAVDVGVEGRFFFGGEEPGVSFIDDDDVGVGQIGGGGGVKRSVDDGAVLGEELGPIGEELGVVVLAGLVGFEAGP